MPVVERDGEGDARGCEIVCVCVRASLDAGGGGGEGGDRVRLVKHY